MIITRTIRKKLESKKRIKCIKDRFPSSVLSPNTIFNNATFLEGDNLVYAGVNIIDSIIGYATYINGGSYLPKCKIGKYCSIGSCVEVVAGMHPTNYCSSYPGFYDCASDIPFGRAKNHFDEYISLSDGFLCHIGNDVWIGNHTLIRGGLTIGDGAIIGMGSVVTKDVPPYAIVAGNPARIIRYRFDEETVSTLLSLKWWNWDPDFIKKNRELFNDPYKILSMNK